MFLRVLLRVFDPYDPLALLFEVSVLRATVFAHQPLVPALNKWTKLGPCCDALLFGLMMHNIWAAAFETLRLKNPAAAGPIADDPDYAQEAFT